MNRRSFVQNSSVVVAGFTCLPFQSAGHLHGRPFKLCLNPGAIGVNLNQHQLLKKAKEFGFEAIIGLPNDLLDMDREELEDFTDEMKASNISWGSTGLPVEFRKDEMTFREGLKELPSLARQMERAGATRMNTWIMPTHAELTYKVNFHQHRDRIKEMANILGHYGVRLGLEYVGPKTLMTLHKYSFIRTMAETKDLIASVGEGNVGFVLDSFHWYCAGESDTDILSLDVSQIVTVDLNDARTGFSADQQIDGQRELPGATGVINLKSFLQALTEMGYDGPVRAEPFNQALRDMEDDDAIKATYEAMTSAFLL